MTLEPETGNDQSQVEVTPAAVVEAPASAVSVEAVEPVMAEPEQVESSEPAEVSVLRSWSLLAQRLSRLRQRRRSRVPIGR